jgi:hypothetical protein
MTLVWQIAPAGLVVGVEQHRAVAERFAESLDRGIVGARRPTRVGQSMRAIQDSATRSFNEACLLLEPREVNEGPQQQTPLCSDAAQQIGPALTSPVRNRHRVKRHAPIRVGRDQLLGNNASGVSAAGSASATITSIPASARAVAAASNSA